MSGAELTVADVATRLRRSKWWVKEQCRLGKVEHLRLGDGPNAPIGFTEEQYKALLATFTVHPEAPRKRQRRRSA